MLAIIIPAHNEADHIAACVNAARRAASHRQLQGEETRVIVVLDSCSDDTGAIAQSLGADLTSIDARNVGMARRRRWRSAHAGSPLPMPTARSPTTGSRASSIAARMPCAA